MINPLSANPTKWSYTLKQFVGNLPANCLSVFDHFVGLALKGLIFVNQSFTGVLQKRCSKNIRTFCRKTPVLEYLFNKVEGPKVRNFI